MQDHQELGPSPLLPQNENDQSAEKSDKPILITREKMILWLWSCTSSDLKALIVAVKATLDVTEQSSHKQRVAELVEWADREGGYGLYELYRVAQRMLTKPFLDIEVALQLLEQGGDNERAQASEYLGKLKRPEAVPILNQIFTVEMNPGVKYWMALALGQIGTHEAIDALKAAYTREHDPLRESDPFVLLGIDDGLRAAGYDPSFLPRHSQKEPSERSLLYGDLFRIELRKGTFHEE
jgi:HEAT repeat protein